MGVINLNYRRDKETGEVETDDSLGEKLSSFMKSPWVTHTLFTSVPALGIMNALAQYRQGKDNAAIIEAQAQQAADAQRAQGDNLVRSAQSLTSATGQYQLQAAEELRQGAIDQAMAANEQIKGEREAAKRSKELAEDVGAAYAQFAANGFMVDAAVGDTFGAVLDTMVAEGTNDVATIVEGAKMNQWSLEESSRSKRVSAGNSLASANHATISAEAAMKGARSAYNAAAASLSNGYAAARNARKSARRGLVANLFKTGVDTIKAGYKTFGTED